MSLTENVKCPDKVSFPLIALCLLLSSLLETGVYIGMQGFPAFKKKKKKRSKRRQSSNIFPGKEAEREEQTGDQSLTENS